jgi:hypothetical protein
MDMTMLIAMLVQAQRSAAPRSTVSISYAAPSLLSWRWLAMGFGGLSAIRPGDWQLDRHQAIR